MSVNKARPHLLILPEDDANRQIATGFDLAINSKQLQILKEAGGWPRVVADFDGTHRAAMERFTSRYMILLVDCDGNSTRLDKIRSGVPEHLLDRVFVIGALHEPEDLRQNGLGGYEEIGRAIARDCRDGTKDTWSHDHLAHNQAELDRLSQVCSFLFGAP